MSLGAAVNVLWIPAAILIVAAVIDQRHRLVSDGVPLSIVALAALFQCLSLTAVGWFGMFCGVLLGGAIGAAMSWTGGLGSGDALLLAALGFLLGPVAFAVCFGLIAVVGAGIALYARVRGAREVAYVPAIAGGYVAFLIVQAVLRSRQV